MVNDSVKLEMRGDIQIDVFAEAIKYFSELVIALSKEIAGQDTIEWGLDTLDYGSPAFMVWQGRSDDLDVVESVVGAVETVGQSLERGVAVPYNESIRSIAMNLAKVPNGKIDTVLLGSTNYLAQITSESISKIDLELQPSEVKSYGQVVGTAETVSSRQGFVVTIYDELFEKAVRCYFDQEQKSLMRDMWEKRVSIHGYITRDAYSGRPRAIHEISSVEFLAEPDPDNFLSSRGTIPYDEGDDLPENIMRRFRDAF